VIDIQKGRVESPAFLLSWTINRDRRRMDGKRHGGRADAKRRGLLRLKTVDHPLQAGANLF